MGPSIFIDGEALGSRDVARPLVDASMGPSIFIDGEAT